MKMRMNIWNPIEEDMAVGLLSCHVYLLIVSFNL